LDYGENKSMASKQNSTDLMIHRLEGIYSVNNTMSSNSKMSSELSNATSIEFLG
jgi:hypothetical protein